MKRKDYQSEKNDYLQRDCRIIGIEKPVKNGIICFAISAFASFRFTISCCI